MRGVVEVKAKAGATTTRLRWRQVTRYRPSGCVQEHFLVKISNKLILDEYRLNGHTLRLAIISQVPGSGSLTPRHLGQYWQSGYVVLDRKASNTPYPSLPTKHWASPCCRQKLGWPKLLTQHEC